MNYYTAFNLAFDSTIDLPGYNKSTPQKETAVSIIRKPVSASKQPHSASVNCFRTKNGITFSTPFGVHYALESGKVLIYSSLVSTPHTEIERTPLYGYVLAGILQQAGLTVLHGNTMCIGDKIIIIAGEKGSGKSTLSTQLIERGHRLLSDDISAIKTNDNKSFALPGLPVAKLWKESIARTRLPFYRMNNMYYGTEKQLCFLSDDQFCNERKEVDAIIILGRTENETRLFEVTDVREKLFRIISCQYFINYPHLLSAQQRATLLSKLAVLTKSTKLYLFTRQRELNLLTDQCIFLEKMLQQLPLKLDLSLDCH